MKIGIIGYGNLGKGVEQVAKLNPDIEVVGIFTRRNPESLQSLYSPVYGMDELPSFKGKVDVMILCGGSATDLEAQGPEIAKDFNTVDSFDTHAKIPAYFETMDKVSKENGLLSLISTGWDPGLFSLQRVLAEAVIPSGSSYTFWGPGISQGHSDAIRRIEGVADGRQYTLPNEEIIDEIRKGNALELTTRQKHTRLCYVVLKEGADEEKVKEAIVTMPNYFADYDTTVHFISQEELNEKHSGMPHGGHVIRTGKTNDTISQTYEFTLNLDSNPEFTASVQLATARALHKLYKEGKRGTVTVFDIPIGYFSPKSPEELRKSYL